MEWQEENSSLIQATEGLKKMLQEKEQEWEVIESSMKTQLEDLMSKERTQGRNSSEDSSNGLIHAQELTQTHTFVLPEQQLVFPGFSGSPTLIEEEIL